MDYEAWQDWWVSRADTYFTKKVWDFSQPQLVEKLGIAKGSAVLEIGFGYGRELSRFCEICDNVYGLELAQWSCDNTLKELDSRGVAPLPDLQVYDGLSLPFADNVFDVIYSCYVVQHLSREHAQALIRDCLRTLKPAGSILFEFFGDLEYYNNGQDVFSGIDGQGGMFNNGYTFEEIPDFVGACGGAVRWIEHQQITETWRNQWVCIGAQDE